MLREMGIRVWTRELPADEPGADTVVAERPTVSDGPAVVRPPASPDAAPRLAPAVAEAPAAYVAVADGLAPADWLVVGEPLAAGADPALLGQLLDNLLRAARVARDGASRDVRAAWVEAGPGRRVDLDAAIASVAPRVVLALGKAAAQTLLGLDEPLGKLREREHARGGVPVVVSFDLAYLLRHPAEKAKAWADLCRAAALLG